MALIPSVFHACQPSDCFPYCPFLNGHLEVLGQFERCMEPGIVQGDVLSHSYTQQKPMIETLEVEINHGELNQDYQLTLQLRAPTWMRYCHGGHPLLSTRKAFNLADLKIRCMGWHSWLPCWKDSSQSCQCCSKFGCGQNQNWSSQHNSSCPE